MNFLDYFSKKNNGGSRVFLDYAGGTFVLPEVKKEILKYFDYSANPSGLYKESIEVKGFLGEARGRIAKVLNIQKNEIVFTSGGTEGNNLAILGIFEEYSTDEFTPHFITTSIEHASILEVFKEIKRRGGETTILNVGKDGLVNKDDLKNSLKENTVLVSIALANSEIGTIQHISELTKIVKDFRKNKEIPYFHSDGSGGSIYTSLNVNSLGLDMLTLDASKIYGPKGVGLLFVKSGTKIKPIIFGGGQERGLRSGTENISLIMGLARAVEESVSLRESETERLLVLREYCIDTILKNFPSSILNGSKKYRLPNNINICFPGLDAEFIVVSLDLLGISVSYSSSCMTLKEDLSSYVIANTTGEECSKSSLRFTLGLNTTKEDIDKLVLALRKVVIK